MDKVIDTAITTVITFLLLFLPVFLLIDKIISRLYVMLCAIWYHFYNLRNVKNIHGRVLLLVKLQAEPTNFTKSNIPSWVFFTFFKLYKGYQIEQIISYCTYAYHPLHALRLPSLLVPQSAKD